MAAMSSDPPAKSWNFQRRVIGLLSVVCLSTGIVLWQSDWGTTVWVGMLVRIGMVLAAFWLALPSGSRAAAWANVSPSAFIGVLLAAASLAAWPKVARVAIPIAIAVAVIAFFLRPRKRERPRDRRGLQ